MIPFSEAADDQTGIGTPDFGDEKCLANSNAYTRAGGKVKEQKQGRAPRDGLKILLNRRSKIRSPRSESQQCPNHAKLACSVQLELQELRRKDEEGLVKTGIRLG